MGIPINGPTFVYGDNKSVLVNSSQPDSVLKKKNNSVAYHHVGEGITRDEWRVAYINTDDNQLDPMTKCLPFGDKRQKHCHSLLYWLYDNCPGS